MDTHVLSPMKCVHPCIYADVYRKCLEAVEKSFLQRLNIPADLLEGMQSNCSSALLDHFDWTGKQPGRMG